MNSGSRPAANRRTTAASPSRPPSSPAAPFPEAALSPAAAVTYPASRSSPPGPSALAITTAWPTRG